MTSVDRQIQLLLNKQAAIARINEVLELAIQKFPSIKKWGDVTSTPVLWDLHSGRHLGQFCFKSNANTREVHSFILRFNPQMLRDENMPQLLQDTIPHEVAHLVAAIICGPYEGHGSTWSRIAVILGCDGNRLCRDGAVNLKPIRTTREFVYILDSGDDVIMSSIRHNKIQKKGATYRTRDGQIIAAEHFFEEA
ncbi:SprT-like protein [Vibrio phage 2.275.O._10N.286.54.E11]|nr:SprT-like protein [Vibrio phage 2.275.O._10N.286.54.E11]